MFSMLPTLRSLLAVFLAVVLVAGSAIAHQDFAQAQTSGSDKPVAGATPGGVNSGSASDAELWRKIRRGDSGTVVGGNPSGGMMIQSGGQDWRLIRNGPLPKYVAWAILGMLMLLSLFFALRGRIKVSHGLSHKKMQRFSLIERVGHWLLASSFILLAFTGLNLIFGKLLLIPVLGKDTFASITVFGKFVHNYVAFAFILGLIMIIVMWISHNIPNWTDVKWLLRGGGVIGGGHPPAKKFNAGQKIIFWIVVLCGISISMSGWALMNPFTTNMFGGTFALANDWIGTSYATDLSPIQEQQYQSLWHTIMAVLMIIIVFAHIYIGTIGMEGALPAMTSGEVDTNWAREHHSLWVEDEEAKHWGETKPQIAAAAAVSGARSSSPSARLAALAGTPDRSKKMSTSLPRVDSASDSRLPRGMGFVSIAKPTSMKSSRKPPAKIKAKSNVAAKPKAKPRVAAKAKSPITTTKSKAVSKPKTTAKSITAKRTTKKTTTKSPTRRVVKPSIKAVAKPKASAKSVSKIKPRSRDDLRLIKGVGPQNEKKLNAIGVRRFEDVAKWTKRQQSEIGDRLAFPGRIEREEWVKQAKALARGTKKG